MPTNFLILHGYGGGKDSENWQTYLANALKDKGQNIIYPDFPYPNHPQLEEWLVFLEDALKNIDPNSLVVAGHSLGSTIWLHYISKHPGIRSKRVFLVVPPLNDCNILEIANFFPLPKLDLGNQKNVYTLIGSNDDPFILENEFKTLAKNLKIPFKKIPNAGHINVASGYGEWEWMNKECLKYV